MLFAGLIWFDYLNFLEWQRTFGTLGVVSENLKHTGWIFFHDARLSRRCLPASF